MSKAGFTVKILKDLSPASFTDLRKRLDTKGLEVHVGFPEGRNAYPNGTPVALVAAVQNFGSPDHNIPERPFMVPGIKRTRPQRVELNRRNLLAVLRGQMTLTQALGQLGAMAVGGIQKQIRDGEYAPLAEATIKAKGSSKPLLDSGHMVNSVEWVVEKRK